MKFITKKKGTVLCGISLLAFVVIALSGCGREVHQSYSSLRDTEAYRPYKTTSVLSQPEKGFASDLCLAADQNTMQISLSDQSSVAAGLFDIGARTTAFGNRLTERVFPASTTKIMTALVALKHGDLKQKIVISERAANPGADAQRLVLDPGDTMTLDQALHYLMVFSANDVAIAIAENIGGSYDGFVEMMNEEAHAIGATQTHFTNPHGLHDENHYTTAYDLYLILNEAMKNEAFREIVKCHEYNTTFVGAEGESKSIAVRATDAYLTGDVDAPEGITVLGGKTGTTEPAGHCLVIMSENKEGEEFISIVMKADSIEDLYSDMNSMLAKIPN